MSLVCEKAGDMLKNISPKKQANLQMKLFIKNTLGLRQR
jgi:hypothetical protein